MLYDHVLLVVTMGTLIPVMLLYAWQIIRGEKQASTHTVKLAVQVPLMGGYRPLSLVPSSLFSAPSLVGVKTENWGQATAHSAYYTLPTKTGGSLSQVVVSGGGPWLGL